MPEGIRAKWTSRAAGAARLVVAVTISMAVLAILDYGFTPTDDALRHAAQVVSDKEPADFLVVDPELRIVEATPGWNQVLSGAHRLLGLDKYGLVSFSIVVLFLVFTVVPIFFLRRAESWALVLFLTITLVPGMTWRWALGRPFAATSTAVVVMVLLWDALLRDPGSRRTLLACALAAAAATYLHSTWYLLYVVAFAGLLAGRWRAAVNLAGAVTAGVAVGALLTLQPVDHLSYQLVHLYRAFSVDTPIRVSELTSSLGGSVWALLVIVFVATKNSWEELRDLSVTHVAFVTAALSWVGAYLMARTWTDLGLPALMAGLALALDRILETRLPRGSARQAVVVAGVCVALYLAMSVNAGGRWESTPLGRMVYFQQNPDTVAQWLPEEGGVVYSPDMPVFFTFFFTYPERDWRFVTGMEPGLMAPEDRSIRQRTIDTGDSRAMEPWIERMRPQDRLILTNLAGPDPWLDRPELESFTTPRGVTLVRLRRQGTEGG